MAQPPKNVKRGEPVLAKDFNKVLSELRRLGRLIDGNPINHGKPIRYDQLLLGRVSDAGPSAEADYTDSRYWIELCELSNDDLDAETAKVEITAYSGGDYRYGIVTATNLSELEYDTHTLAVDEPVFVFKYLDNGAPPTARYFFVANPVNVTLFPVDVTKTSGAAGDESTKCAFVYTVTDIVSSATLLTGASPTFDTRTSVGEHVAATKGVAYIDSSGTVVLYQVNEVPVVAAC